MLEIAYRPVPKEVPLSAPCSLYSPSPSIASTSPGGLWAAEQSLVVPGAQRAAAEAAPVGMHGFSYSREGGNAPAPSLPGPSWKRVFLLNEVN